MKIKNNSVPIYRQIVEHFEYEIASGALQSGAKISSIRELALDFQVNPNTIVRALSELENNNLIYTDRTNGKYVVDDKERLLTLKEDIVSEDTLTYISKTKSLNMDLNETVTIVKKLWEVNDD